MDFDGELYSNNSDFQKQCVRDILTLPGFFRQNCYRNVLDIGCGSGEVTNFLQNKINGVDRIFGFDKSASMVEFARSKNSNPRIEYSVADVTKPDTFKPEWQQKFDLITSFHVLHWTKNQYKNLENVKSLLSPNGEVLFYLPYTSSILYMSDIMNSVKWSPYFQGYTPTWSFNPDWEEYREWRYPDEITGYRRMAESLGFTVNQCTEHVQNYIFPDRQSAKGFFGTIFPHSMRIPASESSEFLDDALDLYLKSLPLNEDGKIRFYSKHVLVNLQNK
ncbi:juvenile hormone acid O-methyltransferase-like [Tubulanus polymorphus]|uniref:juvenile hormone acid O-methyltransferase-like n=1 Tax=Tubulanus polymorphus TaxID=672921 RepID=UPI003DA28731